VLLIEENYGYGRKALSFPDQQSKQLQTSWSSVIRVR
jgi:hypothetical protein